MFNDEDLCFIKKTCEITQSDLHTMIGTLLKPGKQMEDMRFDWKTRSSQSPLCSQRPLVTQRFTFEGFILFILELDRQEGTGDRGADMRQRTRAGIEPGSLRSGLSLSGTPSGR